jgi:hypothetical protein
MWKFSIAITVKVDVFLIVVEVEVCLARITGAGAAFEVVTTLELVVGFLQ